MGLRLLSGHDTKDIIQKARSDTHQSPESDPAFTHTGPAFNGSPFCFAFAIVLPDFPLSFRRTRRVLSYLARKLVMNLT
ncbi:MAG: hypothetical protein MUE70_14430 [Desulfobacterales bacterium]|nr:hypothetical protein [Desulfobacterales bacterium]